MINFKKDLTLLKKVWIPVVIFFLVLGIIYYSVQYLSSNNQYSKSKKINSRISNKYIMVGNKNINGIPAINSPEFVDHQLSDYSQDEKVIGINLNGVSKAYPISILNWHEVVNDNIGEVPISVTYSPLCDTNMVFIRKLSGEAVNFKSSGKLYQSCLLMEDELTDTLWSQVWAIGVTGEEINNQLPVLKSTLTTLGKWQEQYPDTKVLSLNTGYDRNYNEYPYGIYRKDNYIMFPIKELGKNKFKPKDIVSFVYNHDNYNSNITDKFTGKSLAVSHKELKLNKKMVLEYGADKIDAIWDEKYDTARFYKNGDELNSINSFAFVYLSYFQ